jgi:hypothetical protein
MCFALPSDKLYLAMEKYVDSISLFVHIVKEILDNAMRQVASKSFGTQFIASQCKITIHS